MEPVSKPRYARRRPPEEAGPDRRSPLTAAERRAVKRIVDARMAEKSGMRASGGKEPPESERRAMARIVAERAVRNRRKR